MKKVNHSFWGLSTEPKGADLLCPRLQDAGQVIVPLPPLLLFSRPLRSPSALNSFPSLPMISPFRAFVGVKHVSFS